MLQPSLLARAAASLLMRLSLAAWIEAVRRLSAAVVSSTPSAWPRTRTVRMVSRLGISLFLGLVGEIAGIHRADQAVETVEVLADQAIAIGEMVDRGPRDLAAVQRDRPIGRQRRERAPLEHKMIRWLNPRCDAGKLVERDTGGAGR